jgi:hypothetical protein
VGINNSKLRFVQELELGEATNLRWNGLELVVVEVPRIKVKMINMRAKGESGVYIQSLEAGKLTNGRRYGVIIEFVAVEVEFLELFEPPDRLWD